MRSRRHEGNRGAGATVDGEAVTSAVWSRRTAGAIYRTVTPDSDAVTSWVRQQAGRALEFRTVGQATEHTLAPLYRIFDERYVVFWNVSRA